MFNACQHAEVLAGAIALGEATDLERDEYRRHIAACSPCLHAFGGEREIERTMFAIADARDHETWQPVLTSVQIKHKRRARFAWRMGFSVTAVAVAASLGAHFLLAAAFPHAVPQPQSAAPPVVADVTHITLEHRPAVTHARKPQPARKMLIVHNVVTLKAPPPVTHTEETHSAASDMKTTTVVAQAEPISTPEASDIPIWRRDQALQQNNAPQPAPRTTSAPPALVARAESIQMAPVYNVRDVVPLGGETAINPQPPMIAYSEGAEGTTAFEVSVDTTGAPTKCTITKSSGWTILDQAVCKAAMKARFSPRLVNGRPTTGIYRDAFTFRNSSYNEGIPQ